MQPIGEVINKILKDHNLGSSLKIEQEVLQDPQVLQFLRSKRLDVNSPIVKKSLPNLFEYYNQLHNPDKVMAGYMPQLFLNGNVIDVRYQKTSQKISEDEKRAVNRRIELIDLPEKLRQVSLDKIFVTDERKDVLAKIQTFLTNYKTDPHQRGLYLAGDFGVGKTYILAGVANYVAKMGKKVVFLHVPSFIASLSSHFEDNSLQKEIKRVEDCDLLILDDIGAESLSQWSRDDVLGVILQSRMDNTLPTFFSSNFDLEKLEAHFAETKNAIDPVKAARLMQRVRFLAQEVIVSGPNRRKF